MSKLVFEISAPMQSYTIKTSSNHQYTNDRPTKDAIVGLLSASLGYPRDDPRINELKEQLKVKTRDISDLNIFQPKKITDYQNAHYGKKNQQLWREYIQDSKFEISIIGEQSLLEKLAKSLTHPKFALYLGRRSCPPDRPIIPHII